MTEATGCPSIYAVRQRGIRVMGYSRLNFSVDRLFGFTDGLVRLTRRCMSR